MEEVCFKPEKRGRSQRQMSAKALGFGLKDVALNPVINQTGCPNPHMYGDQLRYQRVFFLQPTIARMSIQASYPPLVRTEAGA
jgi:hypothetical protein